MLRRVTGRVDRLHDERAEVQPLAMESRTESIGDARGRRDHEVAAGILREHLGARDVVVVNVRVEGRRQGCRADRLDEPIDVALRVDDEGDAIVVHDVARVTETGRRDRRHVETGHDGTLHADSRM